MESTVVALPNVQRAVLCVERFHHLLLCDGGNGGERKRGESTQWVTRLASTARTGSIHELRSETKLPMRPLHSERCDVAVLITWLRLFFPSTTWPSYAHTSAPAQHTRHSHLRQNIAHNFPVVVLSNPK